MLVNVSLTPLDILAMMSQPNVLMIELLLDNVVPFLQALDKSLVVGSKELDMLPILMGLLFQTIGLNALFVSLAQIASTKEDKPSIAHSCTLPTASWRPLMKTSLLLLTLSSGNHIPLNHQGLSQTGIFRILFTFIL